MNSKFDEKIAICYFAAGETYRTSARRRLENDYFDDDNIYYFIITDNKSYFENISRKNLVVNELKDFYYDFPTLEKYEALLDATDKFDYAKKFLETNYRYSFSLMRFHFLQAYNLGIKNVALMCTDTCINFDSLNNEILSNKNTIFNAVSEWDSDITTNCMSYIVDRLKDKYSYQTDQVVRVLDAAGRLFIFDDLNNLKHFFDVWNDMIVFLFESNNMKHFRGSYVYNDEYILAPIYNMFGLNKRYSHATYRIFNVNHNAKVERFWLA